MEYFETGRQPHLKKKRRQTKNFGLWKTTSIFSNGRQPQYSFEWKSTSYFFKWKRTKKTIIQPNTIKS
jgi:hypothetical protein